MLEFTQTNLNPGNCWQTAVACLLEIPPETLPDQSVCDLLDKMNPEESGLLKRNAPFYQNELGAYLRKHHGLAYVSIQTFMLVNLTVREPGIHLMSGKTVRTSQNHQNHIVVARHGKLLWDPHPSRAGLTEVIYWSFLLPYPEEWARTTMNPSECHCPNCGGFRLDQSA